MTEKTPETPVDAPYSGTYAPQPVWDAQRGVWVQPAVAYAPPRPTSAASIWSLVLSLLWFAGVGSVAAVILGLIGLNDAKKGKGGQGMAIAGIVIGILGAIAGFFVVWMWIGLFALGASTSY
ncbi:uncharacterized protein DUF4190 [Sediminihabitans luteus]|uniref:Uncharacterized protein DUF4190 n=1 Tax=Sediminihabitans luteus TaxID=1138585 RepID=A0A2M9CZX1_9CELL|nr:DUF4190 domain-containing protein [Sediminihabitans luteus]PJJ77491.1 uncharacterized protein DUF4190 [Sediminihabitans luteus]GII98387.1 hypothetical protein Slu03_07650 [Sediminihabitans luteus]